MIDMIDHLARDTSRGVALRTQDLHKRVMVEVGEKVGTVEEMDMAGKTKVEEGTTKAV